jgi:hypothetical protein
MRNENAGMDFGGWLFFQTCILTIFKPVFSPFPTSAQKRPKTNKQIQIMNYKLLIMNEL